MHPGSSSQGADNTAPEESYEDFQMAEDIMDVDEWEDEEKDGENDVMHALRDFMGDR